MTATEKFLIINFLREAANNQNHGASIGLTNTEENFELATELAVKYMQRVGEPADRNVAAKYVYIEDDKIIVYWRELALHLIDQVEKEKTK